MNGPEHVKSAEELLAAVHAALAEAADHDPASPDALHLIALAGVSANAAQVHATLALIRVQDAGWASLGGVGELC